MKTLSVKVLRLCQLPRRGREDLQQNKAVFPDWDSLENAEVYQYLGEEADSLYNELWKEVKSN